MPRKGSIIGICLLSSALTLLAGYNLPRYLSYRAEKERAEKEAIEQAHLRDSQILDMISKYKFAGTFAIPEELKLMFKHWVDTFTEYSENQVVITAGKDYHVLEVIDASEETIGMTKAEALAQRKRIGDEKKEKYKSPLIKIGNNELADLSESELEFVRKVKAKVGGPENLDDYLALAEDVHSFSGQKEKTIEGIVRSGRYIGRQSEIFAEHGVPSGLLIGIQLSESNFDPNAYNGNSGATGTFQIMGMHVRGKADFRWDPFRSAKYMAKQYLQWRQELTDYCLSLHNYCGNWSPEALNMAINLLENKGLLGWEWDIGAHNPGPAHIKRAFRDVGPDMARVITEYNGNSRFGYSSKNHLIAVIASAFVYDNRNFFFPCLVLDEPVDPIEFLPRTVKVKKGQNIYRLWEIYGEGMRREEFRKEFKRINTLKTDSIRYGITYELPAIKGK